VVSSEGPAGASSTTTSATMPSVGVGLLAGASSAGSATMGEGLLAGASSAGSATMGVGPAGASSAGSWACSVRRARRGRVVGG
jgi:hypothetical protein